jgi:hypothetical protein
MIRLTEPFNNKHENRKALETLQQVQNVLRKSQYFLPGLGLNSRVISASTSWRGCDAG